MRVTSGTWSSLRLHLWNLAPVPSRHHPFSWLLSCFPSSGCGTQPHITSFRLPVLLYPLNLIYCPVSYFILSSFYTSWVTFSCALSTFPWLLNPTSWNYCSHLLLLPAEHFWQKVLSDLKLGLWYPVYIFPFLIAILDLQCSTRAPVHSPTWLWRNLCGSFIVSSSYYERYFPVFQGQSWIPHLNVFSKTINLSFLLLSPSPLVPSSLANK